MTHNWSQPFPRVLGCVSRLLLQKGRGTSLSLQKERLRRTVLGGASPHTAPSQPAAKNPQSLNSYTSLQPLRLCLSCALRGEAWLVFNSDSSFLICTRAPRGWVFWTSRILVGLTPAFVTRRRVQFLRNVGFPQAHWSYQRVQAQQKTAVVHAFRKTHALLGVLADF